MRSKLAALILAFSPALPSNATTLDLSDSTGFVWELTAEITYGGITYHETVEVPASIDSGFVEMSDLDSTDADLNRLFLHDDLGIEVRFYFGDPYGIPGIGSLPWPIDSMEYSFDPDPYVHVDGGGGPDISDQFAMTKARWVQLGPFPIDEIAAKRNKRPPAFPIGTWSPQEDGTQILRFSDGSTLVRQRVDYHASFPSGPLDEMEFRLSSERRVLTVLNGGSLPPQLVQFPIPSFGILISATARFDSLTFSVPEAAASAPLVLMLVALGLMRGTCR